MFESKTTITHLIETAGISSSTWYQSKRPKTEDRRKQNKGRPKTNTAMTMTGESVSDASVIEAMGRLREEPFFQNGGGYRKMTHYLRRRHGLLINKKKVYRLCAEGGLLLPRGSKKVERRTPISINRTVTAPFQLWELDIKYGFILGENRFFYLMAIIDIFLRYVVGFHIGLHCHGVDLVRTLSLARKKFANEDHGSLVIRMDNGPQMTSNAMYEYVKRHSDRLIHELIPVQTPNKDAHIESFYSIVEIECFQTHVFHRYLDGYQTTHDFIDFYQNRRIHSSLGYRTPAECLELHRRGELKGIANIRL